MQFGYPAECSKCNGTYDSISIEGLKVKSFYQKGNGFKLMLIGQDPTINLNKDRVKSVLMLDVENGQLRRWLRAIIGDRNFDDIEIYATNTVKCSFSSMPSLQRKGGRDILNHCFNNCQEYLKQEIKIFHPDLILVFGEPAHEMFLRIVDKNDLGIPSKMNQAFSGSFYKVSINGITTEYSPCLHIKTFRVAETYGKKVTLFRKNIKEKIVSERGHR